MLTSCLAQKNKKHDDHVYEYDFEDLVVKNELLISVKFCCENEERKVAENFFANWCYHKISRGCNFVNLGKIWDSQENFSTQKFVHSR